MRVRPVASRLSKIVLLLCLWVPLSVTASERLRLDDGWRFQLGEATGAAERADFSDQAWRTLSLPHDWSIEGEIKSDAPSAGGGGFFPTGMGWYRYHFATSARWQGQRVEILFEGIYRNADVWLNGTHLGSHAYGYTPFSFDLTPHLRTDNENVLAVHVDNSAQPNSRFYSGSGIFRPVWLRVSDPVHIVTDGVFVSTAEISPELATINVQAAVRNESTVAVISLTEFTVIDPDGLPVVSAQAIETLDVGAEKIVGRKLIVPHPRPWSPKAPTLYRLVTRVSIDGRLVDQEETRFGFRTIRVSAEHGLELNGQALKLLGGNVHHDVGPLGAAALPRAEERKVEMLKIAGFNAVRTAHNPPSTAFLDACDRLGLLVIDEAFDGWAKAKLPHDFHETFARDWPDVIAAMVRRDRNHPSVVMWSIGNEVYERGNAEGFRLAQTMTETIRKLDATRPLTAGINGLGKTGDWTKLDPLFATLDVAGYNYELARHREDHGRLPARVIAASESYQNEAFANWAIAHDQPYMIGDFVWSALDYLGEAGIGRVFPPAEKASPHWEGNHFPWHGAACGDIDLTGWRKPISHYRAIVWDRGEKLYATVRVPTADDQPWNLTAWSVLPALPNWTWPGAEGKPLTVDVYSRHESVRLYLDDRLINEQPTTRNQEFKATFNVPYAPGSLRAVGVDGGKENEEFILATTGPAARLKLVADRFDLRADGQDLAFVTVEIVDSAGRRCFDTNHPITFAVSGPGTIAAIGSGDLSTTESYHANPRHAFQGRALVVVRTSYEPGKITLSAVAEGIEHGEVTISVR